MGAAVRRVEDGPLLTGLGRYLDDLRHPGQRHVAFVRSPFAAGRIAGIDVSAAAALPGVDGVFTASDVKAPGLRSVSQRPEFTPVTMPLLARDRVRHVGEPVAFVVAADRASAEEAAEWVDVTYDDERPVVSMDDAVEASAPVVNEGASSNTLLDVRQWQDPRVADLFAAAPHVVEVSVATGRVTPAPIENRGCLAEWDPREQRLVVHASTQVPHILRGAIADQLGLPENRVRVVVPDVGGGFGLKCFIGREETLVAWAAYRLRSAVKWAEDRYENLTAGFQAREQRYDVRAAFDERGCLLGMSADIRSDVGAYSVYPFSYGIEPMQAASDMPGPYKLPLYESRARAIATNKCPSGPYRGVARPNVTLALERLMEKAAAQLGLNPVELRRRNLMRQEDFPFHGVTGLVYDEGSYLQSLELCAEEVGYAAWPERQERARAEGKLLGLGFSCFNEHAGYGTPVFSKRTMGITVGGETAHLRMDPSGAVDVMVATLSHGQGHHTTLAQIVADTLQVGVHDVRVVQGDTDRTPVGWGTFASRTICVGGGAVKKAATELATRLRQAASVLLSTAADRLELRDGCVVARDDPSVACTIRDLAREVHHHAHRFPALAGLGLEAQASFDPPGTFSNATHAAIVEVCADTGRVRCLDYVVVEDCGVVINPIVVDGQVRGGVAQGIAAALYEEIRYDQAGQPQTATLADYLIPTAAELPRLRIRHLETPSAFTETGAKGMGEGGCIGAPAAILNAVNDALRHLGAEIEAIPITPQRVLAAIRDGRP